MSTLGETFNVARGRVLDGLGGYLELYSRSETITLSTSGATTDSDEDLLPADAMILGVTGLIEADVTGSGVTGFKVGDGSDDDRFSGEITDILTGDVFQKPVVSAQVAAAPLRITAVGGTPTGGLVSVVVYYYHLKAPAAS